MESRISKLRYYINSKIDNLNENENEFIEVELAYRFTNLFRIDKLIWFLKECRRKRMNFEPTLLFIDYCNPKYDFHMLYYESLERAEEVSKFSITDYWKSMKYGDMI